MTTKVELIKLLIQAREFDNQTCRDDAQMAVWRRKVDKALADQPGDDPEQRYDSPAHIKHREFVQQVFSDRGRRTW